MLVVHVVEYLSTTENRRVTYPHGLSPLEAMEVSRTLPQSTIREIRIDLSGDEPKIVSSEILE